MNFWGFLDKHLDKILAWSLIAGLVGATLGGWKPTEAAERLVGSSMYIFATAIGVKIGQHLTNARVTSEGGEVTVTKNDSPQQEATK